MIYCTSFHPTTDCVRASIELGWLWQRLLERLVRTILRNFVGAYTHWNDADDHLAVARIAYLSTHVVLSIQPALAIDSHFSKHLHTYSATRLPGVVAEKAPEVCLQHEETSIAP